DAVAWACLHVAGVCHRHHRRTRFDVGCIDRRGADRGDRSNGRVIFHAFGEKHVRLRNSRARAAVPAAGDHGAEALVIGRLIHDVPHRVLWLLGIVLAGLSAAPIFSNDYLLTVLILILYFAYTGQAWN